MRTEARTENVRINCPSCAVQMEATHLDGANVMHTCRRCRVRIALPAFNIDQLVVVGYGHVPRALAVA